MRRRKIKLPICKGKHWIAPKGNDSLCPWCKKNKVGESMAILNAGALERIENDSFKDYYTVFEEGGAFFYLDWHGAHSNFGGTGKDKDIYASVYIADMTVGGQFEIYFCSTQCLRDFLNFCVDELEQKIETERKKKKRED